jgi:hypothetical protein
LQPVSARYARYLKHRAVYAAHTYDSVDQDGEEDDEGDYDYIAHKVLPEPDDEKGGYGDDGQRLAYGYVGTQHSIKQVRARYEVAEAHSHEGCQKEAQSGFQDVVRTCTKSVPLTGHLP